MPIVKLSLEHIFAIEYFLSKQKWHWISGVAAQDKLREKMKLVSQELKTQSKNPRQGSEMPLFGWSTR